jgi:superfamily II DNA helicase RecQ
VIHRKGSRKLRIGSDHFFRLKVEHEQTVYCLLEGRDVFAVMPTGIACCEVLE